jgi:8-oxo-dGTP pyrophosphatase MutT (NUDIX family)
VQSPDDAPYGRPRPLTLKEQLDGALLDPEEAQGMEVQGGRTHSAVLVPLYVDAGVVHAVFTRRREDLKRHAGEISFPGGRREPGETLLEAALREAHEEIGLPPEDVDVVGALAPVGTFVTNYAIYPFVGLIEPGFEWIVQETEVAEVLEFSLEDLVKGHSLKRLVRRGMTFKTDVYEVDGHIVWGATARILGDLLSRLEAA